MKNSCVSLLFSCLLLAFSPLAAGSDLAKEKRWANQIVDSLFEGEALWLKADGHEFLGIYTEPQGEEIKGGVILLHGIGAHPDWPQVIFPLRTGLAEQGWHTLSLQMPVLPNEADSKEYIPLFSEVAPRIDAGIQYLRERGANEISLIGHSLGTQMSVYYLAKNGRASSALVGVGMTVHKWKDGFDTLEMLAGVSIPVLDLFGEQDLPRVLSLKGKRLAAAERAGNTRYKQIQVSDTDHFFNGKDTELVQIVESWLAETLLSQ